MNLIPLLLVLPNLVQQEMAEKNVPGATLAIVHDGKVVYSAGFGIGSVDTGEPVRAEMLFRAGSTTKMMTAAALVKLSLEGKIGLDDPIGSRLPELPEVLRPLTPGQLLSHTSGLIPDTGYDGSHNDDGLAKNVLSWDSKRFKQAPGVGYSYSNHGYALAGYVIEKLSGKPFADAVNELVFRPIGMQRTTFRPLIAMTWPLAQGHDNGLVVRPIADDAGFWPAGSMFTSVLELAKFTTAFMDGSFDPKVVKLMTTPRIAIPDTQGEQYGYGLSLDSFQGAKRWRHSGSRRGYGSMAIMFPERKMAILLMTNTTGGSLPKTLTKIQEMLIIPDPEPGTGPRTGQ